VTQCMQDCGTRKLNLITQDPIDTVLVMHDPGTVDETVGQTTTSQNLENATFCAQRPLDRSFLRGTSPFGINVDAGEVNDESVLLVTEVGTVSQPNSDGFASLTGPTAFGDNNEVFL